METRRNVKQSLILESQGKITRETHNIQQVDPTGETSIDRNLNAWDNEGIGRNTCAQNHNQTN